MAADVPPLGRWASPASKRIPPRLRGASPGFVPLERHHSRKDATHLSHIRRQPRTTVRAGKERRAEELGDPGMMNSKLRRSEIAISGNILSAENAYSCPHKVTH